MTRKGLIIIGLAAVIAATSGVAIASNGGGALPGKGASELIEAGQTGEDNSYLEYYSDGAMVNDADEAGADATITVESTESGAEEGTVDPAVDATQEVSFVEIGQKELDARYMILRVVDHNSGAEVNPQVAFGRYYRSCYLDLYTDQTFELCLSPSSGEVQTGTYSIEEDKLVVNFGGDRETSFELIYQEDGSIDTVILPNNEYIIYFG